MPTNKQETDRVTLLQGTLDLLIELGCDQAQGYLISRPLAPDAARQYIEAVAEETEEVAVA